MKVTDHDHDKYITTSEFNTLAARVFNGRLAQANVITKTGPETELKRISDKLTSNKSKHLLVENKLKNLEKFDAAYFRGKHYFDNDGTQNYLVFQPVYKYFEFKHSGKASSWESKGLLNEKIASVSASALPQIDSLPKILYSNDIIKLKLSKVPLKQDKATYIHGTIVNIYIVYELISSAINIGITLHNCLFGAVKLTKNADIDKCKYFGYGLDLIQEEVFHIQAEDIVEMLLFLELI